MTDEVATFAAAREAARRWSTAGDVHPGVAERLRAEGAGPVLDVGCGDGELARCGVPGWIGLDRRAAFGPSVVADAAALPIRTGSCGAVTALWCLYLLDEPEAAIDEARRVLRRDGLFAACTTARDDSPELLEWFAEPEPSTFDAEEAAAMVAAVFGDIEVDAWDGPFVHLPDREAVATYLRGRGVPDDAAEDIPTPFVITKRGVLVWARR